MYKWADFVTFYRTQFRMSEKKKGTRFTDEMNKVLIEGYTKNQVSVGLFSFLTNKREFIIFLPSVAFLLWY